MMKQELEMIDSELVICECKFIMLAAWNAFDGGGWGEGGAQALSITARTL